MNDESSNNANSGGVWRRALFMLLFAAIYQVAEIVMFLVVVFQFVCVAVSGERNQQALELGQGLSSYIYEILRFLSFNSERLPFPFSPWPESGGRGT